MHVNMCDEQCMWQVMYVTAWHLSEHVHVHVCEHVMHVQDWAHNWNVGWYEQRLWDVWRYADATWWHAKGAWEIHVMCNEHAHASRHGIALYTGCGMKNEVWEESKVHSNYDSCVLGDRVQLDGKHSWEANKLPLQVSSQDKAKDIHLHICAKKKLILYRAIIPGNLYHHCLLAHRWHSPPRCHIQDCRFDSHVRFLIYVVETFRVCKVQLCGCMPCTWFPRTQKDSNSPKYSITTQK